MHQSHTKIPYQKPVLLRQIEWQIQNGPISKNGVLPVTTLFFWRFCFSLRPLIKSWFYVSSTQMSILVLFVSTGVLFDGAFSLWVSLNLSLGRFWQSWEDEYKFES